MRYDSLRYTPRTFAGGESLGTRSFRSSVKRIFEIRSISLFQLYVLFIAAIFVSGTPFFIIITAAFKLNLSPANILLIIAIPGSIFESFNLVRTEMPGASFWITAKSVVANTISVPRPIRPLFALAILLWGFTLFSLAKDNAPLGMQAILTGLAGLTALWFTARSIRNIGQAITVAIVFVGLTTVTSVLTILATLDLFGIRDTPFITPVGVEIDSFVPGFEREIIFGFNSDTFGLNVLISVAVLLVVLITSPLRRKPSNLAVMALVIILFTSFVIQSRGLWIALPIFLALVFVLIVTHRKYARFRSISVSILVIAVIASFWFVAGIIGGPRSGPELPLFFSNHGPPQLFGKTIPREFVYNGATRLDDYVNAWETLKSNPLIGETSEKLAGFNGHSSYVDLITLAGIGPMVVIILVMAYVYRQITTRPRAKYPLYEIGISLVVALLIINLFYFGIFQKQFWIVITVVTLLPTIDGMPILRPFGQRSRL